MLIGAALVVLLTAGGSYAWFQYEVAGANSRVTDAAKGELNRAPTSSLVSVPESPSAMDILIIGADKRPTSAEPNGRSDTMMVVHVDPAANYLSILSLPRDMWVTIPGHGKQRLNTAYASGGQTLVIHTIKDLTGINIKHYIEVDFNAFKDITNALGGVYVDVDHRYLNNYDPEHEPINIQPGYQLMDGATALGYVRYRIDATGDIGRMNRQQRFLSAAREQAMGWDLTFKLPGIIKGFLSNTATDLSSEDFMRLAFWAVKLDGNKIRQITITGAGKKVKDSAGNTLDVLTVSNSTLANAVQSLLTPSSAGSSGPTSGQTATTGVQVKLSGSSIAVIDKTGQPAMAAAAKKWMMAAGATVVQSTEGATAGLKTTKVTYPSGSKALAQTVANIVGAGTVVLDKSVDRVTLVVGEDLVLPSQYALPVDKSHIANADMWSARATKDGFTVEAPSWIPAGYECQMSFPENLRTYNIVVGGHSTKPAFKVVYAPKGAKSNETEYLGIMETTWLDAPAASKGNYSAKKDGVTYTLVGTYEKPDRVWWKNDGVLYWVSNTLQYRFSANDLMQIAESMVVIPKS